MRLKKKITGQSEVNKVGGIFVCLFVDCFIFPVSFGGEGGSFFYLVFGWLVGLLGFWGFWLGCIGLGGLWDFFGGIFGGLSFFGR